MNKSVLNWFEIPVRDIARAQRFYETLLACDLRREDMGGNALAVFPYADGGTGGALVQGPAIPAPTNDGVVLYLHAGPSLDVVLARAWELGARVLMPKTELPGDIGAIAQIVDCEGNRVGLHQPGVPASSTTTAATATA